MRLPAASREARLLTLAVAVSVSACADSGKSGAPFVRDSAGVRMVDYSDAQVAVALATLPVWTLGQRAELSIGQTIGDSAFLFNNIGGALLLADGRTIVANRSPGSLRAFDAAGLHVLSTGRQGDGPGEYRNLYRVWRFTGDSLATFDLATDRVTVYNNDLARVRDFPMSPAAEEYGTTVVGPFSNGTFLVFESEYATPSLPHGAHRMRGRVALRGTQGETMRMLTELPSSEWFFHAADRALYARPFGARAALAIRNDVAYMSAADSFVITRVGADGALQMRLTVGGYPKPLLQEQIDGYVQSQIRQYEERGAQDRIPELRRRMEETDFPQTLPAISSLALDSELNLWVREYGDASDSARYIIFGDDAVLRARTALPPLTGVLDIGDTWILLRTVGEEGVEKVERYRLLKTN